MMGETAFILPECAEVETCHMKKCNSQAKYSVIKYGKKYSHQYFYCEKHLPKRFQSIKSEGGENNS